MVCHQLTLTSVLLHLCSVLSNCPPNLLQFSEELPSFIPQFVVEMEGESFPTVCFLLVFFSAVSKAYRNNEHVGSVHSAGCGDAHCFRDADCRDLLEKKGETNLV